MQRQLNVRISGELVDRLDELAARNGRALVAELSHAIERHLLQPPTVQVIVSAPVLEPATVEKGDRKAKRGRPRKQLPSE